ncbi:MAG: hypothetical protein F4W92_00295 [Gammaproteobacteria bacterium]|nr:hypothetical protein [Gammaproteobacteria bacterium]
MSSPVPPVEPVYSVNIPVGHKSCTVTVLRNNELRLYVANCLRKKGTLDESSEILLVSSNIELYWEEHSYVEARYDCVKHTLQIRVNQRTVFNKTIL